jgi:hypothetical protein
LQTLGFDAKRIDELRVCGALGREAANNVQSAPSHDISKETDHA